MKKLLIEFLANILEARPRKKSSNEPHDLPVDKGAPSGKGYSSGGKWYKDAAHSVYLGRVDGETGKWVDARREPETKPAKKPAEKPAEPKRPRKPRSTRAKIEKTASDRQSVVSSLGDTKLDINGLMKAIEGVETQETGEKGAGTAASTAGEAATTLGLERLRVLREQNRTVPTNEFLKNNIDSVVKLLSELRGVPGSVLSEDWAEAARKQVMAIFTTVEEKYNVKLSEIAWDNKAGRTSLGLGAKPKSDRSDLYVKTDNDRVIGISLKKDGNIFLANQGLKKVLKSIAEKAPDAATAKKIMDVVTVHKETSEAEFSGLLKMIGSSEKKFTPLFTSLTRDEIGDVGSEKYSSFFDGKTGKLTPDALAMLSTGNLGTAKRGKSINTLHRKLFLKTIAAVSDKSPELKSYLENMRAADRKATQALLELVKTDNGVNQTMTDYLIDSLDLVQLVTLNRPFGEKYPVDKFFIAYGEANLQEDGQEFPMSVTRDTILSTLGLPKDITDEQLKVAIKDKFVVDADEGSRVGFLRLRIKNDNPPPNYFYPSISTLGIRARGLGVAPVMELSQHSGWTYTLLNKTPNPEGWPPHHRYAQAEDSIFFLKRQIKNDLLTEEQKAEIQKDIDFYENLMRTN